MFHDARALRVLSAGVGSVGHVGQGDVAQLQESANTGRRGDEGRQDGEGKGPGYI